MKKINLVKISLDIIMAVVFALLFNKMVFNGMTFHETAGIGIGVAFLIHILLNYKWVIKVTGNLFSKKTPIKTKIGYIIDFLLLICMAVIIFSGIAISKVLFTDLGINNLFGLNMKGIHKGVSYASLALIGIHIGLHWNWVINMFKRMFRVPENKKILDYISKFVMIIVLAFGVYTTYSENYVSKAAMVTSIFQQQMPSGGMPGDRSTNSSENTSTNSESSTTTTSGSASTTNSTNTAGTSSEGSTTTSNTTNSENSSTSSTQQRPAPPANMGSMPSTNPLSVLSANLGIISVFAIFAYYLEKLLLLLTRKPSKGVCKV